MSVQGSHRTCTSSLLQARLLSAKFKALNEKERKKWEKKAEQDKIRYNEEMKHYVPMDDPDSVGGGGKGKRKKAKKVR